ncbi:enoyl-CoA hydratase/isomerase [Maricurvus nonylphenolicus]|uniref:enoyl-CoA hydratase-related protein n=1 Tax=Maricurvus nonylphenolicus TaxID=1008307 RepID=UPI0036F1D3DA
MDDYKTITLDVKNNVATITLNRPQRLNAAPPLMFEEIHAAVNQLQDYGARALVITGEGRAFCSGADLADDAKDSGSEKDVLEQSYNPCLEALHQLPMPVITAANGLVAGIGVGLALVADFCIAARSAYFLQAFVNVGLMPDGGSTWILPRLVGLQRAKELMMLGERLSAEQAEAWGLIYRCIDDDKVLTEAYALAERLAQGPTVALGQMRKAIHTGLHLDYTQGLACEAQCQAVTGQSQDAQEGVAAFVAKRKAQFTGS